MRPAADFCGVRVIPVSIKMRDGITRHYTLRPPKYEDGMKMLKELKRAADEANVALLRTKVVALCLYSKHGRKVRMEEIGSLPPGFIDKLYPHAKLLLREAQ
jgi:hypothetical protein